MSAYSGWKAGKATEQAAETSASAQREAMGIAKDIYGQEVERMKPFYEAGVKYLPEYEKMLSGGYDMKESPAAQYQLQQGTKALNRSLASRGLSRSGNAAQRLAELSSGIAASDWQAQYGRIIDALKLGTGASSSMQQSGSSLTNATQQGASNLANIAMQQGANMASLYTGQSANAINAASAGLKAYQAYKYGGSMA